MRILTRTGLAGILLCGALFGANSAPTTTTLGYTPSSTPPVSGPRMCSLDRLQYAPGTAVCPEFGSQVTITATVVHNQQWCSGHKPPALSLSIGGGSLVEHSFRRYISAAQRLNSNGEAQASTRRPCPSVSAMSRLTIRESLARSAPALPRTSTPKFFRIMAPAIAEAGLQLLRI